MTRVSRKCQLALRTTLELARHHQGAPVSLNAIARRLGVSDRFLETIATELRDGGVIRSIRGRKGGYVLADAPQEMGVGRVIRLMDGELTPVNCRICGGERECTEEADCRFVKLWRQAEGALSGLYDAVSFRDLLADDFVIPETGGAAARVMSA